MEYWGKLKKMAESEEKWGKVDKSKEKEKW